jgi:hypothetical protein
MNLIWSLERVSLAWKSITSGSIRRWRGSYRRLDSKWRHSWWRNLRRITLMMTLGSLSPTSNKVVQGLVNLLNLTWRPNSCNALSLSLCLRNSMLIYVSRRRGLERTTTYMLLVLLDLVWLLMFICVIRLVRIIRRWIFIVALWVHASIALSSFSLHCHRMVTISVQIIEEVEELDSWLIITVKETIMVLMKWVSLLDSLHVLKCKVFSIWMPHLSKFSIIKFGSFNRRI